MKEKPNVLRLSADFTEAEKKILDGAGPVWFSGNQETERTHLMSRVGFLKSRLILVSSETEGKKILADLQTFSDAASFYFPEKDLLFSDADTSSDLLTHDRVRALHGALSGSPCNIVAPIGALLSPIPSPDFFLSRRFTLKTGSSYPFSDLTERFHQNGYRRVPRVENPGEYAFHGEILDFYDVTKKKPVRVDFFDDEAESIRCFEPQTQRSYETLSDVTVFPATEFENQYNEAGDRATLLSFLSPDFVICLSEPELLKERADFILTEYREAMEGRLLRSENIPKTFYELYDFSRLLSELPLSRTAVFTGLDNRMDFYRELTPVTVPAEHMLSYSGNYQGLISDLLAYQKQDYRMVFYLSGRTRAERMTEDFLLQNVHCKFEEEMTELPSPGTLTLTIGSVEKGFRYPELRFAVFTENDLYGQQKKKRRHHSFSEGEKIRDYSELRAGDYVVHEHHGIGIYKGLREIDFGDAKRDCLEISYGKSGTLYVAVTNMNTVQKYIGREGIAPKISRLDSPEWGKTKNRVKAETELLADELLIIYEKRMTEKGFIYSKDTVWQKEFEEYFPFEETEDQLRAIQEVKSDMEQGKIMDRLISGDVGFGKTEVALRAAFKAVQDGKQVAYLVPTTILAEQHYQTFTERLRAFPVTVEKMSRFRTAKELKTTAENLRSGRTDIVIGTHRILSNDVNFKDLGLLIIDEEQRFGVKHKEKIKQLKSDVDVLTLTATPIPRTLHMSMIGVRDMSSLLEPPADRKAIQTYVMEYSDELVREAIKREIDRKGQVYYVHNRVNDIQTEVSKIQRLLPDARVSFAHGKMPEAELSDRMMEFIRGDIDVLVSTTIIETGLDIPNVNTIIIHEAEKYGLAQLYQLRGRVGRSGRQAYAFIMYRKNSIPSEVAAKRLRAIREFTELGSGIKIASADLSIRGAGAILGTAQSGNMAEVGYDLYCKLLRQAVEKAKRKALSGKGETETLPTAELEPEFDTVLDVNVDGYIPSEYIEDEGEKMDIYKRISLIRTPADREQLYQELCDRFREPPQPVLNLMEIVSLRLLAKEIYLTEIKQSDNGLTFRFYEDAKIRTDVLPELIRESRGLLRYLPGPPPGIRYEELELSDFRMKEVLPLLRSLLEKMIEKLKV